MRQAKSLISLRVSYMSINLEMSRTMKFDFVSLHFTDVLELI